MAFVAECLDDQTSYSFVQEIIDSILKSLDISRVNKQCKTDDCASLLASYKGTSESAHIVTNQRADDLCVARKEHISGSVEARPISINDRFDNRGSHKSCIKYVRFSSPVAEYIEYSNDGSDSDCSTIDLDDEFYDNLTDADVSMYAPLFQKNLPMPQLKKSLGFYNRCGPETNYEEKFKLSPHSYVKTMQGRKEAGSMSCETKYDVSDNELISESGITHIEGEAIKTDHLPTFGTPSRPTAVNSPLSVERLQMLSDRKSGTGFNDVQALKDVTMETTTEAMTTNDMPDDTMWEQGLVDNCDDKNEKASVHREHSQVRLNSSGINVPLIHVQPPSPCSTKVDMEHILNLDDQSLSHGEEDKVAHSENAFDDMDTTTGIDIGNSLHKVTRGILDQIEIENQPDKQVEIRSENDDNNNVDCALDEGKNSHHTESQSQILTSPMSQSSSNRVTSELLHGTTQSSSNHQSVMPCTNNTEDENTEKQNVTVSPHENTSEYRLPTLIVQPPSQEVSMIEETVSELCNEGLILDRIPTIIVQPPSPLRVKPIISKQAHISDHHGEFIENQQIIAGIHKSLDSSVHGQRFTTSRELSETKAITTRDFGASLTVGNLLNETSSYQTPEVDYKHEKPVRESAFVDRVSEEWFRKPTAANGTVNPDHFQSHKVIDSILSEDLDITISETITNLLDTVCLSDEHLETLSPEDKHASSKQCAAPHQSLHESFIKQELIRTQEAPETSFLHESFIKQELIRTQEAPETSFLHEGFIKQELIRSQEAPETSFLHEDFIKQELIRSQEAPETCFISASQLLESQQSQDSNVSNCRVILSPKVMMSQQSPDQTRPVKRPLEDTDPDMNKRPKLMGADQIVPTDETHQTHVKEVPSLFTAEEAQVYSCDADLSDPRGQSACQPVHQYRASHSHAHRHECAVKTSVTVTDRGDPGGVKGDRQQIKCDVQEAECPNGGGGGGEEEEHIVPRAVPSFKWRHFNPAAPDSHEPSEARGAADNQDEKSSSYCAPPPCKRARRVGLSRRQRVAPLHAVFRSPEA